MSFLISTARRNFVGCLDIEFSEDYVRINGAESNSHPWILPIIEQTIDSNARFFDVSKFTSVFDIAK